MEQVTVGAAIVAVVEALKKIVPTVHGIVTLVVALGLGAVAGYLQLPGTPDVLVGVLVGAAAAGAHTVAEAAGGK